MDIWSLKEKKEDGAGEMEPQYEPPKFTGAEPTVEIESGKGKLYTGSCHCGMATLALKVNGPLSEEPEMIGDSELIGECDCSICSRVRLFNLTLS